MAEEEPQPKKKLVQSTVANATEVVNMLTYPVAAYLGYTTIETAIRKSMYENFAKRGVFNDLQQQRKTQYLAAIAESEKRGDGKSKLAATIEKVEDDYRLNVRQWFRHHGLYDAGDFWQTLQHNQKIDALVMGATVSGIALGALLTVTHNRSLMTDVFHSSEDEPQKK